MSIAVSTAVYPSKILFRLIASMCAGLILVASVIAFGIIGNTDFFVRSSLALLCCFFSFLTFFRALTGRKTCYLLQVSGRGQMRLSISANSDEVYETVVNETTMSRWQACAESECVRLLPISTLWASVMILHFQYENERISSMIILPDSFAGKKDKTSYRALLVACRWTLRHQTTDCAHPEEFL